MIPTEAIAIVRAWMEPQLQEGVDCPCCDRLTRIYRRNLNSGMVRFLIDFYKRHGTRQVSIAQYHVADRQRARHQEYEKLPHWGLIERTDDSPHLWGITRLGVFFVTGQVSVYKYIWLKHGDICVQRSAEQIGIRQAIGAKFNYDELMAKETIQ